MAQDLAAAGVELSALMTGSWWKSPKMPARSPKARLRAGGGGQVLPREEGVTFNHLSPGISWEIVRTLVRAW